MNDLQEAWHKFEGTVFAGGNVSALQLTLSLLMSGGLSWYVRFLYCRCATTAADTDSLSRVFPLLAIITTALIVVVKSSLALSLGLVGALSIVRFRAAIKEPEELVYLFLCIAIGLTLGAELPSLAIALVAVATIFILAMSAASRKAKCRLLLTVTGDATEYFSGKTGKAVTAIQSVVGTYTLQRLEIDDIRGQVRVTLPESTAQRTSEIVAELRTLLPNCEVSFVNLNSYL